MMNTSLPSKFIGPDNLTDFARVAKELMEESDHFHTGLNDNGQMFIYPCGCEFIYITELATLRDFVEKRNVGLANGSQYDALHTVLKVIEQQEGMKHEPKAEPQVQQLLASGGPVQKRGEARYGEPQLPQAPHPLLAMLAEKLAESMKDKPKVWEVRVSYTKDEGDEYGTMNFAARDFYDVVERLAHMEFNPGDVVNIDLEFIGE